MHRGVRTNTCTRRDTSALSWSKQERKHCLNTKLLKDVWTCPAGYFRHSNCCLYSLGSTGCTGYFVLKLLTAGLGQVPPCLHCWCHLLNTGQSCMPPWSTTPRSACRLSGHLTARSYLIFLSRPRAGHHRRRRRSFRYPLLLCWAGQRGPRRTNLGQPAQKPRCSPGTSCWYPGPSSRGCQGGVHKMLSAGRTLWGLKAAVICQIA